jgi:tetratricopeptide (TPR) repeat protein
LAATLNGLGYGWLREKRYAEAIEVFKLNVELFPESFNAYDSLGEGFYLSGDVDAAIINYRRSLELNPNNTNATVMLERLRG